MAYHIDCRCESCTEVRESMMDELVERASTLYEALIEPHIAPGTTEGQRDSMVLAIADELGVAADVLPDPMPHTQEEADIIEFAHELDAELLRLRASTRSHLRVVK